jgi:uncharacterized protein (TIGR03000 family)
MAAPSTVSRSSSSPAWSGRSWDHGPPGSHPGGRPGDGRYPYYRYYYRPYGGYWGWYPWFYGSFFYGTGYYSDYGYAYGPRMGYEDLYSYSAPPLEGAPPPPAAMESNEEDIPDSLVENENAALIDMLVPEKAEVWFDGTKTTQTGVARQFYTPALSPGQDYHYEIRAKWMENGKEVVRTRKILVRAGDHLGVNFLGPRRKPVPPPSPQP